MMMKSKINKIIQLLLMAILAVVTTSCRETFEHIFSDDIEVGEEVMFSTSMANAVVTRSAQSDYDEAMKNYKVVDKAYEFSITMRSKDGNYEKTGEYTIDDDYDNGTLKGTTTQLYWPSTVVEYGFKAIAGSEELSETQSNVTDWLKQDRLEGFGYIKKWQGDENTGSPIDKIDDFNYRTAKDWKDLNSKVKLVTDDTDYKKIPLFLKHKRARISVILKAGEGVSREALQVENAKKDISATIYSYGDAKLEIAPLICKDSIIYDGETKYTYTTRYDAIVDPYDYNTNPSSELITKINLSGQNYSFYRANDETSGDVNYKLEPGKHLILTVTLGRGSRQNKMSAYIRDWTEEVKTIVSDDYGNAGDPIMIDSRDKLIAFLKNSEQNKAGNVATLEKNINLDGYDENSTYQGSWDQYKNCKLNCTLDLGNFALTSNSCFLDELGEAASLLNGTIQIGGTVDAAIANKNSGSISNINITVKDNSGAYAKVAGAVITNNGTISKCRSALKVVSTDANYVGGIAATSTSNGTKAAVIDGCTVTNRVSSSNSEAKVGGIVGRADGYVTNNTFEYGITLLQKDNHKNIVGELISSYKSVDGNAWPTIATYSGMNNTYSNPYTGVLDNEAELNYASGTGRYRLADDITVDSATGKDVAYELDGNGKQITTKAMIFNAITSHVHDFTLMLGDNLTSIDTKGDGTDVMAPLALFLHGTDAKISNVKVKMADPDFKITSSNPAGLVVWVYGGATVSGCEAKVNIVSQAPTDISQGHKLAGGIVSAVSNGTVTQCVLHKGSTLTGSTSQLAYYGGIVGGIMYKQESGDNVELTITDCSSFVKLDNDEHHGSILGYGIYKSNNGTAKGCQGNWWPTDADCRGVGTYVESVEAAIGKRNAIAPTSDSNY